jgi:hypothetical protein
MSSGSGVTSGWSDWSLPSVGWGWSSEGSGVAEGDAVGSSEGWILRSHSRLRQQPYGQ